jgi:hypothetical protein
MEEIERPRETVMGGASVQFVLKFRIKLICASRNFVNLFHPMFAAVIYDACSLGLVLAEDRS